MAKHTLLKRMITPTDLFSLPNSSPFAKLLDSFARPESSNGIRAVHARVLNSRFGSEVFIQNKIIDAYGRCNLSSYARRVFDKMPERNVFSWNAVIGVVMKLGSVDDGVRLFELMPERDQCSWNLMVSGFSQCGRGEEALGCFADMHNEGFVVNEYSFGSGLSACSQLKDLKMGVQIHGLVAKSRCSLDVYMGSALIDMYSKCGVVNSAHRVFDGMIERNVVSWNSLITCYEQNGPPCEALVVFLRMMENGLVPDEVTLASVVSACASTAMIKEGLQIHARVAKCDKFRDDLILSNAFVDMYAKCGRIKQARCIFDTMPTRNVVSETSLVSGYAKVARVEDAGLMFSKMSERNVVSWNALIAGYTQNGESEEALGLFRKLQKESICPTHYTFGNVLNACANLADLQIGRQAHAHVVKHGFRFQHDGEPGVFVGNSLIDMYMKCGSTEDGRQVFETMVERDCVSWNAMIVGYAQNGYGTEALEFFNQMLGFREKPDHVTMIGVLSACSHAGLVEKGRHYFFSMIDQHGLLPVKDHYTCMVDLLGRAGYLDEAKNLIESMPMQPDSVVWGSLLGACKVHGNIDLGEYVAEKLLEIDPTNSGPYVLLSNMYAELGKWRDVVRIRKKMRLQGVVKQPGCSWTEVQGKLNVFLVKDKKHPRKRDIYSLLKLIRSEMQSDKFDQGDCEIDEESDEFDLSSCCEMEMQSEAVVI